MEQDQTLLNTLYTVYTRSQYKMLFPIVNCSLKKHKNENLEAIASGNAGWPVIVETFGLCGA